MAQILDFKDFKFAVGETIGFCQMIEHDVKTILATIAEGDYEENFEYLNHWTLGQLVNQLEEYDKEKGCELFSYVEYRILKDITKKRNYICHEIFRTFVYTKDFLDSEEYMMACNVMLDFHEDVVSLAKSIERVRRNLCINIYR